MIPRTHIGAIYIYTPAGYPGRLVDAAGTFTPSAHIHCANVLDTSAVANWPKGAHNADGTHSITIVIIEVLYCSICFENHPSTQDLLQSVPRSQQALYERLMVYSVHHSDLFVIATIQTIDNSPLIRVALTNAQYIVLMLTSQAVVSNAYQINCRLFKGCVRRHLAIL